LEICDSGAEHFQAKNYEAGADLIERSMLYVSRDEESRSRRASCFRALTLCHMALRHLDRAQEFINEAEKVPIILIAVWISDLVIVSCFLCSVQYTSVGGTQYLVCFSEGNCLCFLSVLQGLMLIAHLTNTDNSV
jgi:hypothetical protein